MGDYFKQSLLNLNSKIIKEDLFKMKDHSRHKSLDTVAGYVRDAALFDDHAGEEFL